VPLWKSNIAATFSRESADFMFKNSKFWELYDYLKLIERPEDGLWGSLAGNPEGILYLKNVLNEECSIQWRRQGEVTLLAAFNEWYTF
jgi:hypothetical protein